MRLHKEHGLNPTMSSCIICKKETGEIALLGANYKGEAPMHMTTSVIPCNNCKKKYLRNGVMMVNPKTGSLAVIKTPAFKRVFPKVKIPINRIVYAEEEVVRRFLQ